MESVQYKKLLRSDSLEDFEFCDDDGDLEIDVLKSPEKGKKNSQEGTQKVSPFYGLISVLCKIAEEQGLVASMPVSAIASTAVGAVTGSLLGGPSGLAIGLITGAIIAYRASPTRSKNSESETPKTSIRQIFRQMSLQQKKELLQELLACFKQHNVKGLLLEILKNEEIRKIAMDILSSFLMKRMGISLIRPK